MLSYWVTEVWQNQGLIDVFYSNVHAHSQYFAMHCGPNSFKPTSGLLKYTQP